MAVDVHEQVQSPEGRSMSAARRFLVGTNVIVATVLVVGIVGVAQAIGYYVPWGRIDMTSSGVNSLSEGTANLLRNLETEIRITSLYFETDREEEDQALYRRAVYDLIELYEGTNRAKVTAEWVNPLKDHAAYRDIQARLPEKKRFAEQMQPYRDAMASYQEDLDGRMRALVQQELDAIATLGGAAIGEPAGQSPLTPIENLFMRWQEILADTREQIEAAMAGPAPRYGAVKTELISLYRDFSKTLKDVGRYGDEQATGNPGLSPEQKEFLQQAGDRYAALVADLEARITTLEELEPLDLDDVLQEIVPTSNAILVETDEEARVVDFSSVWPPVQPGMARAGFDNRAFKGEEKLTAAILRITHKEQTAVIFVSYGGQPLFAGGFMPSQPQAPYANMKQQLEDANFIVREWDLKTGDAPPEVDPEPTRTIFVVLKPTPPQRGPMGQPSQEPPFSDADRQKLLNAMGDNPRALFIAGWYPGPFGPIPANYEYNTYLEENWGIKVDTEHLLIQTVSVKPGQYLPPGQNVFMMENVEVADHPIVSDPLARQVSLPWCAPLVLSESPPEGVELTALMTVPPIDGIWGVKNIQEYQTQLEQRRYMTKEPEDLEGPFDLAAVATTDDAKVVVISSRNFAEDEVAFVRTATLTSQGLSIRSRNPGNVTLLVNSLHWLNDNTQFMNIGKPIDAAVLQVPSERTVKAVQAFAIFGWPAVALLCGAVVWWVRRR